MTTLLATLKDRFDAHPNRHRGISWGEVQARLEANSSAVATIQSMQDSGGEPDLIIDEAGDWLYVDCCPESPPRRSLCYDSAALNARKEHKPAGDVVSSALEMGARLLDEQQYFRLQEYGEFDLKTSSWIHTPEAVRSLGGALFGDRRYNRVFVFHNGAESYYGSRGFRVFVRI